MDGLEKVDRWRDHRRFSQLDFPKRRRGLQQV
jgi:hypothetical protein